MATVLALETSADACSLALLRAGVIVERHEMLPRSHTLHVLPMVDAILAEVGIQLHDLDAIAFGRGPGSFTGLRVCASVVQGLAYAAQIPCVPVSSLQALAQTAIDMGLCRDGSDILCSVDARMNELYCARYTFERNVPVLRGQEFLCAPQDSGWGSEPACRVGSGWRYAKEMGFAGNVDDADLLPHASAVVRLGEVAWEQGLTVSAEKAVPVYLRDDVAWR